MGIESAEENKDQEEVACEVKNNLEDENDSTNLNDKKTAVVCVGCGKFVDDSLFLVVDDLVWHTSCLKCCVCGATLSDEVSCFVRNGSVYCREDYQRTFHSRSCAHCRIVIDSHDFVMRVRDKVYHAEKQCFACHQCNRPLMTGDKFVEKSGQLLCYSCFQLNNFPRINEIYSLTTNKSGRLRKRKRNNHSNSPHIPNLHLTMGFRSDELADSHQRTSFSNQKSKRVRTSFKHHQLCAMKNYFDLNHNPDAKDLKQLAEETGLTKRVLQVWFQNARAKYRRSCQQGGEQSEKQSIEDSCDDPKSSDSNTSSFFDESPSSDTGSEEAKNFFNEAKDLPTTSFYDYGSSYSAGTSPNCEAQNFDYSLTSLNHLSPETSSLTTSR